MDNEFLLFDRITKIQQVIKEYGEENFFISFSGGKDSTIVSELFDMAIPDNKIPRVYADTGIEYNLIREFVAKKAKNDSRFIMLKPTHNIKKTLEMYGYPFKSKEHAAVVASYQNGNTDGKWIESYKNKTGRYRLLDILAYQLTPECKLKISEKCCLEMKEKPMRNWQKEHNIKYAISGVRRSEGGRRSKAQCLAFSKGKLKMFQPLAPITSEWEEWFINTYNIELSNIYYPPFNFSRTGCKGCPFNPQLQRALDIMQEYFPEERKQCEYIWKPVYEEYRRIGYRLTKNKETIDIGKQMTIYEFLDKE